MRLLYKKITLPVLTLVLITGGGCKKFVDIAPPINSITTTTLFANDVQAASAMAGIYATMISGGQLWSNGGLTLNAGLSADEISSSQLLASTGLSPFETARLTSIDGYADGAFWAPIYKLVDNANAVIDGVNASTTLSDSAHTEIIAECRFIRAFCFFYLTNLYGNLPMPLTSDFNTIALLSRTPQVQVYQQIIQDLTEAQAVLPDDYSRGGGQRIIPNKSAATALLARAYLYTKDWKDADAQASALISDSKFSLVSDLTKVFLKNSAETIWALEPNPVGGTPGPSDASNFVPFSPWSPDDAIFLDPSVIDFSQLAPLLTPNYYLYQTMGGAFEPNDQRKVIWVGYTLIPAPTAPYTGDTLFYPTKYPVKPSQNVVPTEYYMVLRLAEQYLIRAEAKAEEGDLTGSAADINAIRARASLPPTTASNQADLLTAVLQERRVELFAEWGHRFLDLKRTGLANAVIGAMPIKQPWNGNQLLYPISANEIKTDPNLTQNPGY